MGTSSDSYFESIAKLRSSATGSNVSEGKAGELTGLAWLCRCGLIRGIPFRGDNKGLEFRFATFSEHLKMSIHDCKLISLPKIADPRGNLTFIEGGSHIPFDIQRVYYLYDVPGGAERGGHAHKALQQLIIAISGSFDIKLDDGAEQKTVQLNRSYVGLLVPTMVWREIDNFSSGAVCLVMASEKYDEADYYRDYDEFKEVAKRLRVSNN